MAKILFMGGVFNDEGGRPSGYVRQLTENLKNQSKHEIIVMNGGFYSNLNETIVSQISQFQIIFWFCDVPNDKPKLVKYIKEQNPNSILIISKNNRSEKYTQDMLVERILKAQANYLLEFKNTFDGKINATLLSHLGYELMSKEQNIQVVASTLIKSII